MENDPLEGRLRWILIAGECLGLIFLGAVFGFVAFSALWSWGSLYFHWHPGRSGLSAWATGGAALGSFGGLVIAAFRALVDLGDEL